LNYLWTGRIVENNESILTIDMESITLSESEDELGWGSSSTPT